MKKLIAISEQITERINQFIEDLEKNGSTLDKTVYDMKKRINIAKEHVATAIAGEQTLKRTYQMVVDKVKMWDEIAKTSIEDGDHEQASEANQHKEQLIQRAQDLEQRIQTQENIVTELKTELLEFYLRLKKSSEHVESLSHRKKQAETRAAFYKVLAEFDLHDDSNAFQQAEEELKAAEEEAKRWEERSRKTTVKRETPKKENKLDEALAALKNEILGDSQND
ncbi:hypothetical protein F4212_00010 [Candidatus Poribacteria bacterium]|nr:hypothetical protein [Candidatus Poribacteria bacterium]